MQILTVDLCQQHSRRWRSATCGHESSAHTFNLATFLVGQRDDNAFTDATNELKRVLILVGDFVNVMR